MWQAQRAAMLPGMACASPPLDLLIEAFQWVGGMQLNPVLAGESYVGEHGGFAVDDEGGELGPASTHHLGDVQQRRPRRRVVGLLERLAQRGGNHGVLTLRHIGERIAGPVHAAALPGGAEDADDRRLEPLVGVGDHQLDAGEAAPLQALQEVRPEHLGLPGRYPTISRRPSILTATAIIAATETIRPAARTFR